MKIHIHDKLRRADIVEATSVVICDAFENPVAVAVEVQPNMIITETIANEQQFHSILRSLGMDRTVIVKNVQQQKLPHIGG